MEAAASINNFATIAEESAEEDEGEPMEPWEANQHYDSITAAAWAAMDDFQDAQSELEALKRAEEDELEEYMEWLEMQAADEPPNCTEFEDMIEEARIARGKSRKVVKDLTSGHGPEQVVKPLKNITRADLPVDYHGRTEQEKIDTFKNQDFGRQFEARQSQLINEQAARAHAAIAGHTTFKILSGPKDPKPELYQGLDF